MTIHSPSRVKKVNYSLQLQPGTLRFSYHFITRQWTESDQFLWRHIGAGLKGTGLAKDNFNNLHNVSPLQDPRNLKLNVLKGCESIVGGASPENILRYGILFSMKTISFYNLIVLSVKKTCSIFYATFAFSDCISIVCINLLSWAHESDPEEFPSFMDSNS